MKIILKEYLDSKGISMYWLSKQTGIAPASLSNLCNNKTSCIEFELLDKICDVLQCTPNEIFPPGRPMVQTLPNSNNDQSNI